MDFGEHFNTVTFVLLGVIALQLGIIIDKLSKLCRAIHFVVYDKTGFVKEQFRDYGSNSD